MNFPSPLIEARFLKRYQRFFADVSLNGETVVAHVPNTGSLKGCLEEGSPCLLLKNDDPKRKLRYTLQMIRGARTWVGVNTANPGPLVWELWQTGQKWQTFDSGQAEVKISSESRIDLVLWDSKTSFAQNEKLSLKHCQQTHQPLHFIEIKNVTLADDNGCALFPDCVSTRAQKHVRELMRLQELGHQTECVFVVQREDCASFRAASEIDPEYARLLAEAQKKGVKITALSCQLSPAGILLQARELALA